MNATHKSWGSRRMLVVFVFLLLLLGTGALVWKRDRPPAASFRNVSATRGDLAVTVLSTGTVAPENRLDIKPPIPGRVEQVLVREGETVQKGQVLAWMSSTERAALLDAARARGSEEVKRWEDFYRATPILAPIRGTIILRNVEAGQSFTSQDPVFVMSDRLIVKAQVDETDLARVRIGQAAKIVLDAYPDRTIPAHVSQIAFDATVVSNVTTYIVYVLPDKTPPFMRSGMTANATFVVDERRGVLLLPVEAVKIQDQRSTVLQPAGRNSEKPATKEISTGLSDGKEIEIVSGLSEGETVLVPQVDLGKSSGGSGGSNPFSPFGSKPRRQDTKTK